MPIYCFECGVEVSEAQKVVRKGRVYCSQAHATSQKQKPAPPRVKSPAQPAKRGAAMKVRELVAWLAKANPDDIVAIGADSKCLLLLNQRPGMFQPLDEDEGCAAPLNECDKEFLRVLRVQF